MRESNEFLHTVFRVQFQQTRNLQVEVRDGLTRNLDIIERTGNRVEDLFKETIHLTLSRGGSKGDDGVHIQQWRESTAVTVPRRQQQPAVNTGSSYLPSSSPENSKKKRTLGPETTHPPMFDITKPGADTATRNRNPATAVGTPASLQKNLH